MQDFLERWIARYVLRRSEADAGDEGPAAACRRDRSRCRRFPGKPGSYNAVAWLRPWLQLEELTQSLRMVASLPKKAG